MPALFVCFRRRINVPLRLLFVACALSFAAAAAAEEPNYYLRGEVGQSQLDALGLDESSTAILAAFGYRFTPYLGAEVFYGDFGQLSGGVLRGSSPLGFTGFVADLDSRMYGVGLSIRYPIAQSKFFMGAQGGVQRFDTQGRYSFGGFPGALFDEVDQSENGAYLGINVGYTLSERFDISARWTRYRLDLQTSARAVALDPEFGSLGLEFRF
jgi:hypothetical protein